MQKTEKSPDMNSDPGQTQSSSKTCQDLTLVEAALYVAGRPLDLKELCSVMGTRSKNKARRLVKALKKEYSSRDTALEVLQLKNERYVLQLKTELTPYVKKIVKKPLLSMGPLKTLAYIAYRQPVSQNRVADTRGHHAYSHIRQLKQMDLIMGERRGRSTLLKTTDYFADYFGLTPELHSMKRELKKAFERKHASN